MVLEKFGSTSCFLDHKIIDFLLQRNFFWFFVYILKTFLYQLFMLNVLKCFYSFLNHLILLSILIFLYIKLSKNVISGLFFLGGGSSLVNFIEDILGRCFETYKRGVKTTKKINITSIYEF